MSARKTFLRQHRSPLPAHTVKLRVDHCPFVQQRCFVTCAHLQYVQTCKAPLPPNTFISIALYYKLYYQDESCSSIIWGVLQIILLKNECSKMNEWCKAPACVISMHMSELVNCSWQARVHHCICAGHCPNAVDFSP